MIDKIKETKPAGPYEVWIAWVNEDSGDSGWYKHRAFATLAEANACAQEADEEGADGVFLIGTTDDAKAAIAATPDEWTDQCHAADRAKEKSE